MISTDNKPRLNKPDKNDLKLMRIFMRGFLELLNHEDMPEMTALFSKEEIALITDYDARCL